MKIKKLETFLGPGRKLSVKSSVQIWTTSNAKIAPGRRLKQFADDDDDNDDGNHNNDDDDDNIQDDPVLPKQSELSSIDQQVLIELKCCLISLWHSINSSARIN